MAYFLNTESDRREMLARIGATSVESLFDGIPPAQRLGRLLDLPPALTEWELTAHLGELASRNLSPNNSLCFLGGGSYDHFIPAVVDYVASRGEFYTSYTPYQAEASQGNLQVFFEYQTLITQLTGMDVSNASMYDGGSAAAEAVLMCLAATRRPGRVVVVDGVHPEYRQVLATYLENLEVEIVTVASRDGAAAVDEVADALDERTACLLVQQPNFFGGLESMQALAERAHAVGALLVVIVDPISLGILARPGDYGADVVVAEGQSLGSPLSFGGPYLGILACREQFVRRLPGRITGQTVDSRGNRCWVLTLQTREQHIRRENATSNICTNQGLFALRATVYLAALGPAGLAEVATLSFEKARYAAERLANLDRFELPLAAACFKEFVVRDRWGQVDELLAIAASQGILAGVPLGTWYPDLSDAFLVTVTEKRTRSEIDRLVACLATAPSHKESARA